MVEAAIAYGYRIFGVSEHAPRFEQRYLYPNEIALGWNLEKLAYDFDTYAKTIGAIANDVSDRITILRAFEAEVVPSDRYVELMHDVRRQYAFDYIVGSVHWVDDICIDSEPDDFAAAAKAAGGVEPLVVRYYTVMAEMVHALEPEVVGHMDVIGKFAPADVPLDTPPIRRAAERALAAMREHDCILDVNCSRIRLGLNVIYPAPWLLELATGEYGLGVCFGDDSHKPSHVGGGILEAREYLLRHGVGELAILNRRAGSIVRETAPLE